MYDGYYHDFVMGSVNRYINSHSLIVNPFNEHFPMEGVRPMGIGYFKNTIEEQGFDHEVFIFAYLNGAVVYYKENDNAPNYQLFIEKNLVTTWHYPEDYFDKEALEQMIDQSTTGSESD